MECQGGIAREEEEEEREGGPRKTVGRCLEVKEEGREQYAEITVSDMAGKDLIRQRTKTKTKN